MTIPDYQTLMLPLLRQAARGVSSVAAILDTVADDLGLSDEDRRAKLPSGFKTVLSDRLHWAKTYLGKAGLIESPARGLFTITPAGRALLDQNPDTVSNQTLKAYPSFQKFYSAKPQMVKDASEPTGDTQQALTLADKTPEDMIDTAHKALSLTLNSDLLEQVHKQTPAFFEQLIIDLLVAMGYGGSHADAAQRIGGTGDGGIDGIISEDRLGLDQIYVQAKRYASHVTIGRETLQSFVGSLVGLGATKGVFVTTSSFSRHAIAYVKNLRERIVLIDGERLASLMIEHGIGVRVSRVIEVKRLDYDFFESI